MRLIEVFSHLFHPRKSNNHRPRILHPEAYGFLILIGLIAFTLIRYLSLFSLPSGFVLGFASSITSGQVAEQTNAQRQALGLSQLTINAKLSQAALAKAQDMFNNQYWSHTSPSGVTPWNFIRDSGYTYKVAGENLARDFSNTPDMVSAWMASPTHRDNIVNPKYQEIGIAVVDGQLLGYETTLVVQMFGTKLNAAPVVDQAAAKDTLAQKPAEQVVTQPALKEVTPVQAKPVEEVVLEQPVVEVSQIAPVETQAQILSSSMLSMDGLTKSPLFSPLQLVKAFFLAMILLIASTLVYDTFVISNSNVVRLVGKNLAHLMLFLSIAFVVIFFKGGMIR